MLDWDDLGHLLAMADRGSMIAAARALGVSQSTVQRRIAKLERTLGRPLLARTATGYALTPFGAALVPHARAVAEAVAAFRNHAARAAGAARGLIRLTCPEPVVPRLTPLIQRFEAGQPGIAVEFVTSDRYLDLARGDADVAFRSGDTDADLVGRKVADSVWAVYASRGYLDRRGRPDSIADLDAHAVATLDGSMAGHRVVRWLATVAPGAQVAARANSVLGLLQAVRSGLGIAPLPTTIADAQGDLVQLFGPLAELARTWRLLTTRQLRREPRIAAFFDFVAAERRAIDAILN